jgi:hypothetical protein
MLRTVALTIIASLLMAHVAYGFSIQQDPPEVVYRKPLLSDLDTRDAVYACSIRDGRTLSNTGEMLADEFAKSFIARHTPFTFGVATGEMRTPNKFETWTVLRVGDDRMDLIANIEIDDPVRTLLRIQVWAQPVTFTMVENTSFYSGTCLRTQ